jgi:hypothetical protein
MTSRLIPFTLRAKGNAIVRKVLINESAISSVYITKYDIVVTMKNEGHSYINRNPSKTDFKFWQQYKRREEKEVRWDMPSPDPLAMEELMR